MENIIVDKLKIKRSWEEVTISEFLQIKSILESPNYDDFEKELRIIALLSGFEDFRVFDNVPKSEAEGLFSAISFLNDQPKGDIQDLYLIGGIEYRLTRTISGIKAGQFIDLTTYIKDSDEFFNNLSRICSVFLIPTKPLSRLKRLNNRLVKMACSTEKGAAMVSKRRLKTFLPDTMPYVALQEESNLMMNMTITQAMGIAVFFLSVSTIYIETILPYLEKEAKQSLKSALSSLKLNNNPKSQVYTDRLDLLFPRIMDGYQQ